MNCYYGEKRKELHKMLQLASKNYKSVEVRIRGDEVITMSPDKGLALMDYLTKDNSGSHVMLTDTEGGITVISRHEIKKIVPQIKSKIGKLSEMEI